MMMWCNEFSIVSLVQMYLGVSQGICLDCHRSLYIDPRTRILLT